MMRNGTCVTSAGYDLPPIGTAGLERWCVSGNRRVPRPPPRMIVKTSFIVRPFYFGSKRRGRARRQPTRSERQRDRWTQTNTQRRGALARLLQEGLGSPDDVA